MTLLRSASPPVEHSKMAVARAVLRAIVEARTDEGAAGLLLALTLRRLRDERLYTALGADSLISLLARELPALDRRSVRTLLKIADAFIDGDFNHLAVFGLARLSLAADADPALRAELVAGQPLPLIEMRRALRSAVDKTGKPLDPSRSSKNKYDPLTPQGPEPDYIDPVARTAIARSLLASADRSWREVGVASWNLARLLARFRDEALYEPLETSFEQALVEQVAIDSDEATRSLALLEILRLLPVERREAAGIAALRAVAGMKDETARSALIERLKREPLAGDALIDVVRRKQNDHPSRNPIAETTPHLVDDPERLAPFNLFYIGEEPDSGFIDATPKPLIEQLLLRASRPGSSVLDLTAGRGTVAEVGRQLGRRVTSIDILDPPLAPDVIVDDARSTRPDGAPFHLVVLHPPIPGGTIYSERYAGRILANDLSILQPDAYYRAMIEVLENAWLLTKRGGTMALISRESRSGERLYDWPGRLGGAAEKIGFVLIDRLYVPLPPAERMALLRRVGFTARREGRTIPVVLSALLFRRPEHKT